METWIEFKEKERLKEMALTDREISKHLYDATDNIVNHLMKLYFLEGNQSANHWMCEIWGSCHSVAKRKSTKKFPSRDFIYDNLLGYMEDNFDALYNPWLSHLKVKYNFDYNLVIAEDKYVFFNMCKDYFEWLSEELSLNGYVEQDIAIDRLKELVNIY